MTPDFDRVRPFLGKVNANPFAGAAPGMLRIVGAELVIDGDGASLVLDVQPAPNPHGHNFFWNYGGDCYERALTPRGEPLFPDVEFPEWLLDFFPATETT